VKSRDGAAPPAEPFEELEAIYRDADALFAGWSCSASTDCCRFAVTGREPYVTSVEVALLRRALAATGRRDPGRRALEVVAEGRCPLLTPEGRCQVYAARPLGCRTFYCGRASPAGPVRHRDVQALVRRVQELAARHEPDGDRGRPLRRALGAPAPSRKKAPR
jgi:hypothetical protein